MTTSFIRAEAPSPAYELNPDWVELNARVVKYACIGLFLAAVFPYIRVIPLGTDTQPWTLLLSLAIVTCAMDRAVRPALVMLFMPAAFAVALLAVDGVKFEGIRSVANYMSVAVISYAAYLALKFYHDKFRKVLEYSVWIWGAVGLIQTLFSRSFMTFLLPGGARTSATRGVTGLAPEPTHYGIMCILLMFLVLMDFRDEPKKRRYLTIALLAQIILFARSSTAALVLIGVALVYVVLHINSLRRIIIALGVAVAGAIVVFIATQVIGLGQSRLLYLIVMLAEHPEVVFVADRSVGHRLAGIVYSLYGFWADGGIPHGFGVFYKYVWTTATPFSHVIPLPANDRILSGYGAALFEIGLAGLLYPIILTWLLWTRYRTDRRAFLLYSISLNALMLTAVPLSTPIIGLLYGHVGFMGSARARRTNDGHLGSG